jgi:hypothetical protein
MKTYRKKPPKKKKKVIKAERNQMVSAQIMTAKVNIIRDVMESIGVELDEETSKLVRTTPHEHDEMKEYLYFDDVKLGELKVVFNHEEKTFHWEFQKS